MNLDSKSVASHQLVSYSYAQELSTGTGFFVYYEGVNLLITNYHVLSGRHPKNGEQLGATIPDRVLIPVLCNSHTTLNWIPIVQMIFEHGESKWSEHPTLGREFDVVALPVAIPSNCQIFPYSLDEGPDFALNPSSNVSIIGFPEGMSASGITAIWKTGNIASEIDLDVDNEKFFWVDSNTRKGMSGSPVIARRFGQALMKDGSNAMYNNVVDRILGVYAGRALEAPDMTLGRVWKWSGVQEVIKFAVSKYHRGILRPQSCYIGHFIEEEKNMVTIDITKNVNIPVTDQSGRSFIKAISVADVIRETVLNDGRFGQNLERVKIAAKIASALDDSLSSGKMLEVEDSEFGIICEAVENPTNPYNAGAARLILPLLQSILESGNEKA